MSQLLRSCSSMHSCMLRPRHRFKPSCWKQPPVARFRYISAIENKVGTSGRAIHLGAIGSRAISSAVASWSSTTSSLAASNSSCSSRSIGGPSMRSIAVRVGLGTTPQRPIEPGNGFVTLGSYVHHEVEVKKSKFVVHAWPVTSPSEALSLIHSTSDPSASHNCFAYRVGAEFRSSDDGEPGGTAGRPILAAIDSQGLDHVAVLVTRYFGGIKLGPGGLVRAYGGAAKECLRQGMWIVKKTRAAVVVEVSYDELGVVYGCLDMHGCKRVAEEFGSSGTVEIRAMVDADRLEALKSAVADVTGGRRRVELAPPAGDLAATAAADS
ncbi:hypothetical protein VOLCADRAFT_83934 [Volvox carteri f. nagariensis]|uniref:Impact N-terminal domain-containing protein n=1 Tax=Volvox carteri f. nagariensis TaxID=3068 RepID=D8UEK9_VOLCA|nr:uncharacterized protein VOLCADRAFT_83934 [Volvox carteri f. nagariensis]EFJ41861.1 hypothetical protein VOLCADRAFT_83934 [Volvox carteri f. nagariensis]|eukprot:XP_002957059.1 hypothetical protein VOLCADRAFT_83934 [Volvox carteri f. nagariensis]